MHISDWLDSNTQYMLHGCDYENFPVYIESEVDSSRLFQFIEYPLFSVTGKRLSVDNAFDLLSKTDICIQEHILNSILGFGHRREKKKFNIRECDNEIVRKFSNYGYVWSQNSFFYNDWCFYSPKRQIYGGYVQSSGVVGCFGIANSIVSVIALLEDIIHLAIGFDYIDILLIMTRVDNDSRKEWMWSYTTAGLQKQDLIQSLFLSEPREYIDMAIRIRHNKIDFLCSESALDLQNEFYKDYSYIDISSVPLFGIRDKSDIAVSEDYVRKMFESYGILSTKEIEQILCQRESNILSHRIGR